MANIRNANTYYIDTAAADHQPATTGNLAIKSIKVSYITMSSSGVAEFNLRDVTTDANKINVKLDTANKTEYLDFSDKPLLFPNGIHPETVTNCKVTLVLQESQG